LQETSCFEYFFLQFLAMKPKKAPQQNRQYDLFRSELVKMINPGHPLVKLSKVVEWKRFEEVFGESYCPDNGRPAISTRLMVALHYLKYSCDLSDEEVVSGWVENPYWQYLSGMKFFEHELPIHPSSMTRWRKRIGEGGMEEMLQETLAAGLRMKAVKISQLQRINVDTTVQEKDIRFPTDARLYDRARQRLVAEAKKRGIILRQNYNRNARELVCQQSRYAHARQMKRAQSCTRKLKTYLGRVIRDIERKCSCPDGSLDDILQVSRRIFSQKRNDKNKVYSVHESSVECISKGKAHKRFEFGCKVSVAATSRGGWFVGAQAFHGNPYDGHTLADTLAQVERISGLPEHVYVDQGYRGHGWSGDSTIHVDKRRRGKTARSVWRWMKRRAAVEPGIGHLKQEHRLDRNRLKGVLGDQINAILSAAGMNFRKLLRWLEESLRLIYCWLLAIPQGVSRSVVA
jgi:transposase, IS5 family